MKPIMAVLNHFILIMRYIYLYIINYFYISINQEQLTGKKFNLMMFISAEIVAPFVSIFISEDC
jgi:hypothetical protein